MRVIRLISGTQIFRGMRGKRVDGQLRERERYDNIEEREGTARHIEEKRARQIDQPRPANIARSQVRVRRSPGARPAAPPVEEETESPRAVT